MKPGRRRGFTLVELMIVIVIIGLLASLLLPAAAWVIRQAKISACAQNLSQLWKAQHLYVGQSKHKSFPTETGQAFWLKLTQTKVPIVDAVREAEAFNCPLSASAGEIEYRGPSGDVNYYKPPDPVGADLEGAHGPGEGGNVLLKNGSVAHYGADEAVWREAAQSTKP